jgi:hypothetical protein
VLILQRVLELVEQQAALEAAPARGIDHEPVRRGVVPAGELLARRGLGLDLDRREEAQTAPRLELGLQRGQLCAHLVEGQDPIGGLALRFRLGRPLRSGAPAADRGGECGGAERAPPGGRVSTARPGARPGASWPSPRRIARDAQDPAPTAGGGP